MRLILVFLMLIASIIVLVQNQQAIAIYFLGTDTKTALCSLKLPLGLWVILFTLGGILTSLLMQGLTQFPRQAAPKQTGKSRPRPQDPPETPYQRPKSNTSDWENPLPQEWEDVPPEDDDDEWDIEEPPIEKTIPRKPSRVKETKSEFEVQQPSPTKASQEGTVYSYTYRELSDRISATPPQDPPKVEKETSSSSPNPNKKVYDADYRVITPPYQPPQESEDEDDESWI